MNRRVRMTLGELIATVTGEVEQSSGRNVKTNMVVSQILNRLFNEGKVRFSRRAAPIFS
jgi:transcriptional regulator NrdR family protein